MKKKGLTSKQKKQIIIGGFAAAAALGIGGVLYYLSTQTTVNIFGPPLSLASVFVMPVSGYTRKSVMESINAQGGTCTKVSSWLPEPQTWQSYPFYDASIAAGEFVRIVITDETFSWTP